MSSQRKEANLDTQKPPPPKKVKLKLKQNNEKMSKEMKSKDSKDCLRFPVISLALDTI